MLNEWGTGERCMIWKVREVDLIALGALTK